MNTIEVTAREAEVVQRPEFVLVRVVENPIPDNADEVFAWFKPKIVHPSMSTEEGLYIRKNGPSKYSYIRFVEPSPFGVPGDVVGFGKSFCEVVEVQCKRAQDVTDEELTLMGVNHYGAEELAESNPFVWVGRFKQYRKER